MTDAYLNRVATAVPAHDVHRKFVDYAPSLLAAPRDRKLFQRMAERAAIDHRYSCLAPAAERGRLDTDDFFRRGAFPSTGARMRRYENEAPRLAERSVEALALTEEERAGITHLILTSCTGFYAPGLDLQLVARFGLSPSVERTVVGFMGCYAAINALKLARHIVRAEPGARVLMLNLELCTLHLQENPSLEQVLSFLIFADGCAASLVSATPEGFALRSFHAALVPEAADQITWHIGDAGFDMVLSGRVPRTIAKALPRHDKAILGGVARSDVALWAIHPGGRTVLDAVADGFALNQGELAHSREVLRRYGNMSSATVMFVLKEMLDDPSARGLGCAMAFGPGLTAESMTFERVQ